MSRWVGEWVEKLLRRPRGGLFFTLVVVVFFTVVWDGILCVVLTLRMYGNCIGDLLAIKVYEIVST